MDKYQCVVVRLEDREKQKNIELYASETEEGFRIGTTIDGIEIYADGEGYFETFQRCRDKRVRKYTWWRSESRHNSKMLFLYGTMRKYKNFRIQRNSRNSPSNG